jgi:hypothetical protein
MNRERFGRHIPLGIQVAVKGLPGGKAIDQLDAADSISQ